MIYHGYSKITFDHCVFIKKFSDEDFIILLFYMNDILIIGHDARKIESLKRQLSKSFATKDLGPAKHILGMRLLMTGRVENFGYLKSDISKGT